MSTNATSDYIADTGSIEAILVLLVFLIAFALILGEVVDRVLAAWGGAVGMLLAVPITAVIKVSAQTIYEGLRSYSVT